MAKVRLSPHAEEVNKHPTRPPHGPIFTHMSPSIHNGCSGMGRPVVMTGITAGGNAWAAVRWARPPAGAGMIMVGARRTSVHTANYGCTFSGVVSIGPRREINRSGLAE